MGLEHEGGHQACDDMVDIAGAEGLELVMGRRPHQAYFEPSHMSDGVSAGPLLFSTTRRFVIELTSDGGADGATEV